MPNEDPSNASIRRKREVRKANSLSLPDKESIHGIISPILFFQSGRKKLQLVFSRLLPLRGEERQERGDSFNKAFCWFTCAIPFTCNWLFLLLLLLALALPSLLISLPPLDSLSVAFRSGRCGAFWSQFSSSSFSFCGICPFFHPVYNSWFFEYFRKIVYRKTLPWYEGKWELKGFHFSTQLHRPSVLFQTTPFQ